MPSTCGEPLMPSRGTLGFVLRQAIFSSRVINDRMLVIRSSVGSAGFWKGYSNSDDLATLAEVVCEGAEITKHRITHTSRKITSAGNRLKTINRFDSVSMYFNANGVRELQPRATPWEEPETT